MAFHRSAARAVTSLLLMAALATPTFAVSGTVNTEGSTLRLRSEANTSGAVLKQLSHGTQVEVLSTVENGWYKISVDELTGYVSGDYLTVNQAEAETLPVEAEPVYVQVVEGPLNVRSGPGTSYDKVEQLATGRVVKATALQDGWYQIESGYISADYVQEVDPSAQSTKGQEIADYALQFVGYPYVYGGSSPKGFDCSGFTSYVYKQFGYSINRTASNQLDNGYAVSKSELQPGDLVMFCQYGSTSRASHVGIYIGNNKYVHASTPGVGVIISDLSDMAISSGFVGARRIV